MRTKEGLRGMLLLEQWLVFCLLSRCWQLTAKKSSFVSNSPTSLHPFSSHLNFNLYSFHRPAHHPSLVISKSNRDFQDKRVP
jgi:hypothetical protein